MKKNQIAAAITCALLQFPFASALAQENLGLDTCNGSGGRCFDNPSGTFDHIKGTLHFEGDPDGLLLNPNAGAPLEVVNDTNLNIVGTNNAYGIRIASYTNSAAQATFHNTILNVEAQSDSGNAVGLEASSASNTNTPSLVTIGGDLSMVVTARRSAKGILAGSDFGNNSGSAGSILLKGTNSIQINLAGISANDWQAKAFGLLANDSASISASGRTDIEINSALLIPTNKDNNYVAGVSTDLSSSVTLNQTNITIRELSNDNTNVAYGIYENVYGSWWKQNSSITLNGPTNIHLITNDKTIATGIRAVGGSTFTANEQVHIALDTSQDDIGGIGEFTGVLVDELYSDDVNLMPTANFKNGLSVKLPNNLNPGAENLLALCATKTYRPVDGSPFIQVSTGHGITELEGNVRASYQGKINLDISGASSYLTGRTNNYSNANADNKIGTINLTLKDNATWNVVSAVNPDTLAITDNVSRLDDITLEGGVIDMTYGTTAVRSAGFSTVGQVIHAKSLTGNNGTFRMDINLTDEGTTDDGLNLDQIVIDGEVSGTHSLTLNLLGNPDELDPKKMHSDNWLISQGAGSMTLLTHNGEMHFSGNGMMAVWHAAFLPENDDAVNLDDDDYRDQMDITGTGASHWYLLRTDVHEPDHSHHPDEDLPTYTPPEAKEQLNVGISASQALAFSSEIEDLRTRLGEVRYGAQDGAWVRIATQKDRVDGVGSGRFSQKTNAFHLGFDHLVNASEEKAWLLGGAVWYGRTTQKGLASVDGTSGRLTNWSGKLYATHMRQSGAYADFVLQAGRYHQTLSGKANDGISLWNGSYRTNGFGASIEAGHMLTISQPADADDRLWYSHWFVEPQLQASWFRSVGADYHTSTGLQVTQDNADFLTLRAGAVLGKKWSFGTLNDLDRRYLQLALSAGVKHECLGEQDIRFTGTDHVSHTFEAADIRGTRFYYALSADWQMGDNFRFYAKAGREESDKLTREYTLSAGLRWAF